MWCNMCMKCAYKNRPKKMLSFAKKKVRKCVTESVITKVWNSNNRSKTDSLAPHIEGGDLKIKYNTLSIIKVIEHLT